MSPARSPRRMGPLHWWPAMVLTAGAATAMVVWGVGVATPAASAAATTTVGLGSATPFAVLAYSEVTNTGASVISGDLGVSPGSSVTGTPHVTNGSIYAADTVAAGAKAALGTAYTDAAGRTPTTPANFTTTGLGGRTLVAGVYKATSTLLLNGSVTLDAGGDPNSVFIFQVGSALTTAANSTVSLVGGAQACNVFWQVGSSATLGTASSFVGTVLAHTSVTLTSTVTVTGRLLAENAAVTLIDDSVARPASCITATTVPGATTTTTTTAPPATTTTAPPATTTTAPTTTTTTTTTTTSPAVVGGSGGSGGSGGGRPSAVTGATTVIPAGTPETGLGGASRSGSNPLLLGLGSLALAGSGGALVLAIRRRRILAHESGTAGTGPDGNG